MACESAQVAVLKYGGLYLRFDRQNKATPAPTLAAQVVPALIPLSATEIAAIQKQESSKSLVQDELRTREDQIEQMLIEDPSEAERLMIEGELEDGDRDEET